MLKKRFSCPYCSEPLELFFWYLVPSRDGREITCAKCHRHATLPYGVRLVSVLSGYAVTIPLLWLVIVLSEQLPGGGPFSEHGLASWSVIFVFALLLWAVMGATAFAFGRLAPERFYAEQALLATDLSHLSGQLLVLAQTIRSGNASPETYASALSLLGGKLIIAGWPPRRTIVVELGGASTRLAGFRALREWFLHNAVQYAAARPNNSSKPTPLRGAA